MGFQFFGQREVAAGQPWRMDLRSIPQGVHSIVIELYGDAGGIFRFFPRGRSEMAVQLKFPKSGQVTVVAIPRDGSLIPLDLQTGRISVRSAQGFGAGAPSTFGSELSPPAAPALGAHDKPPMATDVLQERLGQTGAAGPDRNLKMINIAGPLSGIVGEMINFTAYAGGDAAKVTFSASNADMGWMMPVDISSGSASGSATLSSPGIATIFAEIQDAVGNILGRASHAIDVAAKQEGGRPAAAPQSTTPQSASDVLRQRAEEMQNKLMGRISKPK